MKMKLNKISIKQFSCFSSPLGRLGGAIVRCFSSPLGRLGGALFVLLLLGVAGKAFAQQLPFSSQYYTNPFVTNPAYTGINENINIFATHRSQWSGLAGAPQTSYFTVDGPIQVKNSSLGLKIYSDVTDIISRVGAFVDYSYKLKISDSNNLYLGIACGVLDNKVDFSKALIRDNDDPFLSQHSQNKTVFSADLGLVYVWKKLVIGFAVPQFLGNKIKYPILNGDNSYYSMDRHFQGSIKYSFNVSKEKQITAYPLIMFRSVKGAPFQYDVNAVVDWKKTGWVGLTYHSNYALAISAGVRYHNFCVGYAYDIGTSKIRSYTGSSSEFLLGYIFGQNRKDLNRFVQTDDSGKDTLRQVAKVYADTNQVLLAQLKASSDTNRAEIRRLKSELDKVKTAAVAAPPVISNESKDVGYISSRLVDEQSNPISDVQIEVVDKEINQVIARHKTDNDGNYRIAVPAGKTYDIVFSKTGYLFQTVNETIPNPAGPEKKLPAVTLPKVEVGKKIVLNNIFFDFNQSKVGKESFMELERTVKLMNDIPSLEMEISGHSDNIGSGKTNQELSEQRAKAVMDFIVSKGADANRLSSKGYGASQPIASNDKEEGRKINRRTEFKVLKVNPEYTIVSGTNPTISGNPSDSLIHPAVNPANDALLVQLKAESERNQAQIDKLKSELAKLSAAGKSTSKAEKVVDSLLYLNQEKLLSTFSNENDSLRRQLKVKSDFNQLQIDQLKSELARVKVAGTSSTDTGVRNDSLNIASNNETSILLAKLIAKSDANEMQMDRFKSELVREAETERTTTKRLNDSLLRAALNTETEALRSQLKAKSDADQIQLEQLKSELARVKVAGTSSTDTGVRNDSLNVASNNETSILLAKLIAKSEANEMQMDRYKSELARDAETEKATTKRLNDSLLRAALNTETEALRSQLKAKSDADQIQLEQLKSELAKVKTVEPPPSNTGKIVDSLHTAFIAETNAMRAQLKAKSDENQIQIDLLKEELAKAKTTEAPANTKNDELITQLKAKSDNYQTQIDLLKEELAKTKEAVANANALNSKNAELNLQKQKTGETSQPNIVTTSAGVRTSKTDDFVDEDGKPVGNGFYVIIGTFGNKENADRFKAANIIKGHVNTKMIQNKFTKTYNIFALKTNNKEDAEAGRIKYKVEYPSVWILQIE